MSVTRREEWELRTSGENGLKQEHKLSHCNRHGPLGTEADGRR